MKKSPPINCFGPLPVFLSLFVLGFLAYANAIGHPFVHDDVVFISQNSRIADFDLKNIFLKAGGLYTGSTLINVYYRPLLEAVYRLVYRLFGLNPYGYHLVNILLHIGNSFLVYHIVRILVQRYEILKQREHSLPAGRQGIALAAAAAFLIHPVQTEAVACISGVSNLLLALLFLSSFLSYLSSAYGLSLTFFFLSLLAKEQAVILPFLLMFYQACFPAASREVKDNQRKKLLGYFTILGGYFFLKKIILGTAFIPFGEFKGELGLRLLAIPRTLLMYLRIIVFPHDLHYYRSTDILEPLAGPFFLMTAVIAMIWMIVRSAAPPNRRLPLFGLGFFLISLLPVLNIVPLINEYSLILTAEHFLYLPILGTIVFVWGIGHDWMEKKNAETRHPLRPRPPRRAGGETGSEASAASLCILGVVFFIFFIITVKQNTYWAGEIPLFQRALKFEKHFGRLHILLGRAYYSNGRYAEAVKEYQKAIEIMEGYARKVKDPHIKNFYLGFIKGIYFDLAHCFEALGDYTRAIAAYQEALSLAPDDGVLHNNAGVIYIKMGDVDRAIIHFQKAVRFQPDNLMAMNNLAACYLEKKEHQKAEGLLREILKRDPQSLPARQNLKLMVNGQ